MQTDYADILERISTLRANAKTCRAAARRLLEEDPLENAERASDLWALADHCGIEALRLSAQVPLVIA